MATQAQLRITSNTLNAGSVLPVAFAFTDDDGADSTPTTVRYRVDSGETAQELVAWTTVTPAAAGTFTIPATANAIDDDDNVIERRVLTVEADAGLSTAFNVSRTYVIRNSGWRA